ncbi:NADH-quinone oxidoreductase subunit NuoE [Pleomorphomonas carboxyditropha]|uniref:NADH-quinone oxidoreductase subunit E n=1 Tax=Pleomorphomonas carboxyditropha TaxID=2023338 RepID=A0A2G9WSQ8_9HYPH|nr:NADH-quinone oxidoreductase subunit NuoE [Pleomorphomonas carboxyditropha]PIO97736.1 NADH-quinone oxidoreductase subunit E [Pleomorphomonas carboxyditropha]
MSVRRLHPEQPESFAFTEENATYLRKVIARYPEGRQASAVIPALMVAQDQEGWVSQPAIEAVAKLLDMPDIRVLEVATFYTQFQLSPVGRKAHIQVCGTTPCRLRGADDIIAICKNRLAAHPFELSADGDFSWEEVECAGACVNAPMVTVGKDTYEDLTAETFNALIDGLAAGTPPAPGPQNGRFFSAPANGDTSLTDPALHDGSVVGKYRAFDREELTPTPPAAPAAAPAPAVAPAASAKPAAEKPIPKVVEAQGQADSEKVPDQYKPALLEAARDGKPDDLRLIWGVGSRLEELLHKLGVYHYDQIAGWNEMNLRWVDQHLGSFRGRALRDKWIEQSAKLATGWRPSDKDGDKPA